MQRFQERIRSIEASNGLSLGGSGSSGTTPSPPEPRSILRKPPAPSFEFKPREPEPWPVPQRAPEREAFGGSEPFGGSSSRDNGHSFGGSGSGSDFDSAPSRSSAPYREPEPDSDTDSDSDDSSDRPVSNKSRLGAAIHRLNAEPLNEELGPRDKISLEQMYRDIDIFCHYLKTSQVDISGITIPDPSRASYHEVERVHSLLLTLYGSSTYKSLGEDTIFGVASFLEWMFDGSVLVFNKYPISYKGLRRNMMTKFRSNSPVITNAATSIATSYGMNANRMAMFDLLSPLLTTPMGNIHKANGPLGNEDTAMGLNTF
jgi:hypothetical protein